MHKGLCLLGFVMMRPCHLFPKSVAFKYGMVLVIF